MVAYRKCNHVYYEICVAKRVDKKMKCSSAKDEINVPIALSAFRDKEAVVHAKQVGLIRACLKRKRYLNMKIGCHMGVCSNSKSSI